MSEAQAERAEGTGRREAHPLARVGSVILGVCLIALKLVALHHLLHDGRVAVYVIFGLGAVAAFYKGRPLRCSLSVAVIVAVAVRAHPFLAAVAYGAGAFLVLGILSVLVGRVASLLEGEQPGFGSGWLG